VNETVRRDQRAAGSGKLRAAGAWTGLVLGTMFAAAGLVDLAIAVVLVFGPLAAWCAWLLIKWDREQDRAADIAGRMDLDQQLQRMLRRPEGR